jgi:predicted oxidoreductase
VFRRVALYGSIRQGPPRARAFIAASGGIGGKREFKRSSWLIRLRQRGEEGEKPRSSVMATMEEEDEEDMNV